MPVEKEVQDDNDEKKNCHKKLGLPQEMYIHMVHWYSHLGEKLLRLIYDAMGVKLTVMLEVCDGCAISKVK